MTYCFSFFRIPPFNGLYTPFISPVCGGQKPFSQRESFSKTYPSFLTVKEGSTFLTKPLFPQGREDVTALSAVFAPPVPPQREGPYSIPKP